MSKIVWTPEDGWTDDGPEADLTLDSRGRIVAAPRRANQPHRRTELERDTHLAMTSAWAAPVGTAHRRPLVAAVLVGGLIALASACSTPQPQIGQPAYAVPCRPSSAPTVPVRVEISADSNDVGCNLVRPDRLDERFVLLEGGGDWNVATATARCNADGGTIVGPVSDADLSALCRTIDY